MTFPHLRLASSGWHCRPHVHAFGNSEVGEAHKPSRGRLGTAVLLPTLSQPGAVLNIYLAGPLFTPYQRGFLDDLARRLRASGLEVFVPHENLLEGPLSPGLVFDTDVAGLRSAEVVLAVLDGAEVDDGTACEIGIFSELLRTGSRRGGIVGLVTDIRALRSAKDGPQLNLFVRGCVERFGELHTDVDDAIAAVKSLAERAQLTGP